MKHWDVIVLGGGIIGLTLAIELRKQSLTVLIVERGEPGREASHAAAGMLADAAIEESSPLRTLACASAKMYLEFVHELQDESGIDCDLREQGTLQVTSSAEPASKKISEFEPDLPTSNTLVEYVKERSVDPRALTAAVIKAAKHREVDFSTGSTALELLFSYGKTHGVRTDKSTYSAPAVVNCLGAWAGQFGPPLPVRPVKGQMLCMVGGPPLRHVIRGHDGVYIVPRSDGRIIIGSTLEEAGFEKRTDPDVILRLREAAVKMAPELAAARILESWAGLRPGTSDNLPILGATSVPGYFVATGHFRDGILLAPITARVMALHVLGKSTSHELAPFSPDRFSHLTPK